MKVVCIILFFVIAAEAGSSDKKPAVVKQSKGKTNGSPIQFKYPPYIPNHQAFALSLLKICEEYKQNNQGEKYKETTHTPRINDLKVDFKNCTFLCKLESDNVTLNMPKETPCGPNNQTCEKKEDCVKYIPGC
uniref:Putative ixodes 8-cys protein n=1 Tax=Ixodes ricinus TaxID=34613 RepID=A0A0K8RI72_IXORI